MKTSTIAAFALSLCLPLLGWASSPFTPVQPDPPMGHDVTFWRFSSSLSEKSSGDLQFCYAEEGAADRIVGVIHIYSGVDAKGKKPDLRILFSRQYDQKKAILIVSYGEYSEVSIFEAPALFSNTLAMPETPLTEKSGVTTLFGFFRNGPITFLDDHIEGIRGRLYFRYIEEPNKRTTDNSGASPLRV
jgi:hypothetical protein